MKEFLKKVLGTICLTSAVFLAAYLMVIGINSIVNYIGIEPAIVVIVIFVMMVIWSHWD